MTILTVKQVKTTMVEIFDKEKVWGPMDLIYKAAKVYNLTELPYNTFEMWKGIAKKLLKKQNLSDCNQ